MQINIYSVYDEKAENFGTPFFMKNQQMAERAYGDLVNDPNSTINRHPGDYKLYDVGSFDDVTGIIEPNDSPKFISNAQPKIMEITDGNTSN